jgi:hypothetical protein
MKTSGFNQHTVVALVAAILAATVAVVYLSEVLVERDAFGHYTGVTSLAEQRQIDKLTAEIRKIRSETGGSLFWLKMIGVFVTVGSAVGGYLLAQSQATRARLDFEHRKDVDAAYQAIVKELSDPSALLRAAAAVKLGGLLQDFPSEWNVSHARRAQLVQLTKQVLAAALAIESESKVLKALTIAIALHRPWEKDPAEAAKKRYGDLRSLDLSGTQAADAYWARVDFTYTDFYRADLSQASFREAILRGAQFRDTNLQEAVLVKADCVGANFKRADLRHADLSQANLTEANFEDTKVFGLVLDGATWGNNPTRQVDVSPAGDGSQMIPVREWLARHGPT